MCQLRKDATRTINPAIYFPLDHKKSSPNYTTFNFPCVTYSLIGSLEWHKTFREDGKPSTMLSTRWSVVSYENRCEKLPMRKTFDAALIASLSLLFWCCAVLPTFSRARVLWTFQWRNLWTFPTHLPQNDKLDPGVSETFKVSKPKLFTIFGSFSAFSFQTNLQW